MRLMSYWFRTERARRPTLLPTTVVIPVTRIRREWKIALAHPDEPVAVMNWFRGRGSHLLLTDTWGILRPVLGSAAHACATQRTPLLVLPVVTADSIMGGIIHKIRGIEPGAYAMEDKPDPDSALLEPVQTSGSLQRMCRPPCR